MKLKKMFNRDPFKKYSGRKSSNDSVMLINLLDKKKEFCLKSEILSFYFLYLMIFMRTIGDY